MRYYLHLTARVNEFLRVIALVGSQRDFCLWIIGRLPGVVDHGLGRIALSVAVGDGDHGVGNQSMAVVGERVAHVAQPAGVVAFAVQPGIGIGGGRVCVIAAALAFEVPPVTVIVAAVFTTEAFVPGPRLDEGAINTEVLA